jgi:hypothetical protein
MVLNENRVTDLLIICLRVNDMHIINSKLLKYNLHIIF